MVSQIMHVKKYESRDRSHEDATQGGKCLKTSNDHNFCLECPFANPFADSERVSCRFSNGNLTLT